MNWDAIISLLLISGTKFLIAPFFAEGVGGYNFIEAFTITTTGGFLGIIAFTFFGKAIITAWGFASYNIKRIYKKKNEIDTELKKKKKFTFSNRLIVKVKKRFGLLGISCITPCIISIPFGCFIAVVIYKNPFKVMLYTTGWLIFWSLLLNTLAQFFGLSRFFIG